MRWLARIVFGAALVLVVVIAAFSIYVASRQHLTFDVPEPAISASTDSAVIARGRYIVRTVTVCTGCHGDPKRLAVSREAPDIPLSGGLTFRIPPGEFRARNITPDPETGIGRYTDGQVARALRDGVGPDGRALLPFMEMQGLADDDLAAVVSYLRSQPPVHHDVPMHHYNLLGRIVRATILAKPVGPDSTPPQVAPRGATVENGRYLARYVANCWGCHTQRDMRTGAVTGPMFGGNTEFIDELKPDVIWAPPNLTSDPKTGVLGRMTEDEFVARFQGGRAFPDSPMPWEAYRSLHEDDVRAIYRYLKSLPPVVRDTGPAMRAKS